MMEINVNLVSVALAAVGAMVVGSLWYSPMMFAKPWMKMIGKSEMGSGNMGVMYALAFLSAFIQAYVLAHVLAYVNTLDLIASLEVTIWLWVGFIATTFWLNNMFTGRPTKLYLIDAGYQLANMVVMATVLTYIK